MTKFNPFREAKQYLLIKHDGLNYPLRMYTMRAALEQVWFRKKHRDITRKAVDHFKAAIYPYESERTWLTKTVLDGHMPTDQDMQDYRHRWLDYLAQQWDKGAIK